MARLQDPRHSRNGRVSRPLVRGCPPGWASLLGDRRRGAQALALRALDAALDSRLPLAQLRGCFRRLAAAHPAMAVLANLERAISEAGSPRQVAKIRDDLAGSNCQIARNFHRQLRRHFPRRFDLSVVTLSHSSTVLAALHDSRARIAEVRIARSLPLGEGAAARRAAAQQDLRAALFDDAALRDEVHRCDLVVVGVDSVLRDGSVVNKVGTRLLAQASRKAGKPFWVLASQYKFSKRVRVSLFQTVEGRRIKLFDITPADWVGCLITEAGPLPSGMWVKHSRDRP